MENNASQLIYIFPRGKGEEVQATIRKYKDKYYVDLRVWYQPARESDFVPTRKGFSFPIEQMDEFLKLADRLCDGVENIQKAA